jgi:hypothetical protein
MCSSQIIQTRKLITKLKDMQKIDALSYESSHNITLYMQALHFSLKNEKTFISTSK